MSLFVRTVVILPKRRVNERRQKWFEVRADSNSKAAHMLLLERDMLNIYICNRSTSSIDFQRSRHITFYVQRPHINVPLNIHSNQCVERSQRPNRFILKLTSFSLYGGKNAEHTCDRNRNLFFFLSSTSNLFRLQKAMRNIKWGKSPVTRPRHFSSSIFSVCMCALDLRITAKYTCVCYTNLT